MLLTSWYTMLCLLDDARRARTANIPSLLCLSCVLYFPACNPWVPNSPPYITMYRSWYTTAAVHHYVSLTHRHTSQCTDHGTPQRHVRICWTATSPPLLSSACPARDGHSVARDVTGRLNAAINQGSGSITSKERRIPVCWLSQEMAKRECCS